MAEGMNARRWLGLYLIAVIAISFIHSSSLLAAGLGLALAASGSGRWSCLRRSLLAVLAFNLTVSAGYLLVSWWQGNFNPDYLLMSNLRVLLLVYLGFWLVSRVDLLAAVSGWPLASLLATLAIGQIKTFERLLRDFRLAFTSRNLVHPGWVDRSRHAAAQSQTLLDKAMSSANEAALAMRSRGAFDD